MKTIKQILPDQNNSTNKKRVAAYCRVSNESVKDENSIKNQMNFYKNLIKSNSSWIFVDIYYDKFITGTNTKYREGFKKLINDCELGKIDIILCKSISRFARNTIDLLNTIRKLNELNISVQFEKEQIDTLSLNGELLLSLLASFAQEESKSISDNIKWGIRKKFLKGETNHYILYGYHWNGKEFNIIDSEANIVKRIYCLYLSGVLPDTIAKIFKNENIKTRKGYDFHQERIRAILTNISYTGTDILQKEYIENHITHKRKTNNGELAKYIVENARPQIISLETFNKVQNIMKERRKMK